MWGTQTPRPLLATTSLLLHSQTGSQQQRRQDKMFKWQEQAAEENPNISDHVKTLTRKFFFLSNLKTVKNGAWNWRMLGLRLNLPNQYVLKMMLLDCRDQWETHAVLQAHIFQHLLVTILGIRQAENNRLDHRCSVSIRSTEVLLETFMSAGGIDHSQQHKQSEVTNNWFFRRINTKPCQNRWLLLIH